MLRLTQFLRISVIVREELGQFDVQKYQNPTYQFFQVGEIVREELG